MEPVVPAPSDALSDALRALRFRSSVLCRSELRAPWGFTVRAAQRASFHLVVEGECHLETEHDPSPLRLEVGDVVVLPRGDTHTVRDHPKSDAPYLDDLLTRSPLDADGRLFHGGSGARTVLVCGAFEFEGKAALPLLSALPARMHVRGSGPHAGWLRLLLDTLALEARRSQPGSGPLVDRLMDILFIQAVRAHIGALVGTDSGWLAALRDPQIGAGIAAIHREPEHAWTVAGLAAMVGLSRTVFATRFALLVGESPMRYLARFRMTRAIELLKEDAATLPAIAERVGYTSEVAFSKAFKRHVGVGPGAFRRTMSNGSDPRP